MAEEEIKQDEKKPAVETKKDSADERMIRILATDIRGGMSIYSGLAKIKGVSWGLANAVCQALKINKRKKVGELTPEEIKKISDFIKEPKVPGFILNRQKDFDSGEDKHLTGADLELRRDFDIKRLKQIKSYRGLRHGVGLPTRGQRTKANFRKQRKKSVGVKKKAKPTEGGMK